MILDRDLPELKIEKLDLLAKIVGISLTLKLVIYLPDDSFSHKDAKPGNGKITKAQLFFINVVSKAMNLDLE